LALPGIPGYVTVQSPSQKSICLLSAFSEHVSEPVAAKVGGAATQKHPITRRKTIPLSHRGVRTAIFCFMIGLLCLLGVRASLLASRVRDLMYLADLYCVRAISFEHFACCFHMITDKGLQLVLSGVRHGLCASQWL
jgi:hypothetical protein